MQEKNAAIRAAIDDLDVEQARLLLRDALKTGDGDTYYLASLVALNDEQRREFLQKAIALDPFHEEAHSALQRLRIPSPPAPTSAPPAASSPPPATTVAHVTQVSGAGATMGSLSKSPRSRLISGPLGIFLLIAFFLPWVMYSCGGTTTGTSLSGYDLVKAAFEPASTPSSDPASIAFRNTLAELGVVPVVAVVAILVFLFHGGIAKIAPYLLIIGGVVGLIVMFKTPSEVAVDLSLNGNSTINLDAQFLYGWWLSIVMLAGLVLAGVYGVIERRIHAARAAPK